ncbi:MAG: hypothetical protein AABX12_01600 [Nanoarchaeota archaeon]
MIDVQKVNATKERILNTIRTSGPSFPARVSRETNISPLFIGALLSEMVAERKLVMSCMKVGSSPLYFIPGQEAGLETFTSYLNGKEREAFERLKHAQLLDDEAQDPAIRVALRKIRDFAIPMPVRVNTEEKIFWKFFATPEAQARALIEEQVNPTATKPAPAAKEVHKQEKKETSAIKEQLPVEKTAQETISESKPAKEKKTKDISPSAFVKNVQEYLKNKNMEVIQELTAKTKEYHAKIRIDTPFGQQELFLIAKDKKKITEDDLVIIIHKSQAEKMPSLLLVKGELDKNAKPYLDQWKNLLKYEKLKL